MGADERTCSLYGVSKTFTPRMLVSFLIWSVVDFTPRMLVSFLIWSVVDFNPRMLVPFLIWSVEDIFSVFWFCSTLYFAVRRQPIAKVSMRAGTLFDVLYTN